MILHTLYVAFAAGVLLCTGPLVLEVLLLSAAALLPGRRARTGATGQRCRLAVVVPAHNEAAGIARCVASLRASSCKLEALYVVAHNCTDGTAERAVTEGAEALELNDDGAHGKGAALLFGMSRAVEMGATAVLVVDADSTVDPMLIAAVADAFERGADAVQTRYVASNGEATTRTCLMALSLTGVNVVRPRGRSRLGLSCGIFGNGFALSAGTLQAVPYTAHSVVEDLEYHLALVRGGRWGTLLDGGAVFGELPDNDGAASTQRARGEGGRARMRRQFVPALARRMVTGRVQLLEPLLDLLGMPLATAVPLLLVLLGVPLVWARVYAAAGLATLVLYVAAAVLLSKEPAAAVRALLAVPGYLVFKVGLFGAKRRAARGEAGWVRTARNGTPGDKGMAVPPQELTSARAAAAPLESSR